MTKKLKVLAYGGFGKGKTRGALSFSAHRSHVCGQDYGALMLDTHKGSIAYLDQFLFDVVPCHSADEVQAACDKLSMRQRLRYTSVILDTATDYWQYVVDMWHDTYLRTKVGTVGHGGTYYTFQPNDWGQPRRQHRDVIRSFRDMDAHIFILAQEKDTWSNFKVSGVEPDTEKGLPPEMDLIIHLTGDGMGVVEKTRLARIPEGKVLKFHFDEISKLCPEYFEPEPVDPAAPTELIEEIEALMSSLNVTEDTKAMRLTALFGVTSTDQLSALEARSLITTLQERLKK